MFTTARRRATAILILPLVMLLAGCGYFRGDFEIHSTTSMTASMDIGIESTYVSSSYSSPEDFCSEADSEASAPTGSSWEAYEDGDYWGCRVSGTGDPSEVEGITLTEEDGEFHLTMDFGSQTFSASDLSSFESIGGEFSLSFTFPGEVIEASGGQIDGNTVTYSSFSDLSDGIDIRAEAGGGFPTWAIILIVVVVLGLLLLALIAAVVIVLVVRRRRGSGGGSGSGGPAVPAAFGAAGAAGAAPGQQPSPTAAQWGPAPQPGQQPGQPSPSYPGQPSPQPGAQPSPPYPGAQPTPPPPGGQPPQPGAQPYPPQPGQQNQPGQQGQGDQGWQQPPAPGQGGQGHQPW